MCSGKISIVTGLVFLVLAVCCFDVTAMNIEQLVVVSSSEIKPATAVGEDMPMGQGAEGETDLLPEDDEDLFGLKGGYFHPYISVEGAYTDNVYNVNEETSSFVWRLSPGIWFSLPRTKIIPIEINPHNTSPGGLQLQIEDYEGTDRYQSYLLAGLDYFAYSENSDLNDTNVEVEGLFRYNFRGGLSLQLLDSFNINNDRLEEGAASRGNQRRNRSNLLMATADYTITEKLRAKLDYSLFWLDYDHEINDFLERSDNVLDLYGYFVYSPKSSFFLQYRYTDVAYKSVDSKNNTQHYVYGGMTWDTTEKFAMTAKGGYQFREYEETDIADGYDWDGFVVDLRALYRWTEKTEFRLSGYRKSEETDSSVAIDKVVIGIDFGYRQEYTEKLTGLLDVMYENADYTQLDGSRRDDDRLYIRPALRYLIQEWMMLEVAYMFDSRESTDDIFDYTTNTIMLNLNLSM